MAPSNEDEGDRVARPSGFPSCVCFWFVEAIEPLMASDRAGNLVDICFAEQLVMNGDDDVIEAARPWMGPATWEDVQHMYWRRSGKLPPTD